MILSDRSIKRLIQEGRFSIEPFKEANIQASSIDLTLGEDVIFYRVDFIDVKAGDLPVERRTIPKEGIVIEPKSFLLATTLEYIRLPEDITAFVEGRSSLGRLGLFIENAGWVDAGFEGQITLELYNANNVPIRLYKGMKICQIVLAKLDQPAERPYRGKYFGQRGATPSKIFVDFGTDLKT